MRILIYARAFLPRVGGLESIAHALAMEFARLGHEIVVVTTTSGRDDERLCYRVVRNPSVRLFLHWMRWCDLFLHLNVSLRGIWPLLIVRRPWVVAHHSWYRRSDGQIAWQDRLKRYALRYAAGSIAVSKAIAGDLERPSTVINSCFREDLFRILPNIERARDLVFVGRLVSDKGVDILLDALAILARRGQTPGLTIIGDGPERQTLEVQAQRLLLSERVLFLGTRTGEELARILNGHRILVVPSRYHEPFGIVALEGIACGCAVIGSAGGGLGEAIGPCGRLVRNGDPVALATALDALLRDAIAIDECLRPAHEHLAAHTTERVAQCYLEVFKAAVRRGH
jgi:glycogen(starch) synthase